MMPCGWCEGVGGGCGCHGAHRCRTLTNSSRRLLRGASCSIKSSTAAAFSAAAMPDGFDDDNDDDDDDDDALGAAAAAAIARVSRRLARLAKCDIEFAN